MKQGSVSAAIEETRSDHDVSGVIESLRRKYDREEDWIMSDDFALAATLHFSEAKWNALLCKDEPQSRGQPNEATGDDIPKSRDHSTVAEGSR